MRPNAIAFAIAGFLASVAAAFVVASYAVTSLENATLRTTRSALVASGQSWASVATDGTWVEFAGTAPDEKGRIQALDVLGAVVSTSRIRNVTDVAETVEEIAPDFALEILRSGTDVSLIGITPNESTGDPIREAIATIDGISLIDMKESTDWLPPEGWQDALELGAGIMTLVERAKISISPALVSVTAVVKSDEEKTLLENELASMNLDSVTLETDITAPRPIFSPYSLTFVKGPETATVLCHALTTTGAETILEAARAGGVSDTSRCEIGLGAPTENWAEVVVLGIKSVIGMGGGKFEVQDSGLTITAPEDYDAEGFDVIVANLQTDLPETYKLQSILPQKLTDLNAEERPFFEAIRNAGEGVILNGVIIDDISQRTLQAYSEAKFGHEAVDDNTKLAQFAPHGWTSRQLVALDVLSLLDEGQITVTEETVDVSGKGAVVGLSDQVLGLLQNGFGADAQFSINVEETEIVSIEAELPDASLCETEIAALISDKQILFAPSSALIEAQSEKTISEIALILNRCRHAIFEIGGHTDSQGREEMNKSLSQNRAGAVLDALLARNMLLGSVTAVGYGESQPIAENDTEEGRLENRRIEFKLLDSLPVETPVDPSTKIDLDAPVRRPEGLTILAPEPASEEADG